jgi:hypothetical protein
MGFILKNTSGLVNTRFTDAARQKLSQGKFNISYFQIGDSEVLYNTLPTTSYVQTNTMILEPGFNSQNSSGTPESNKQNVKYPFYVDGTGGNTYGVPFMDSVVSPIYNTAAIRGFFSGDTNVLPTSWSALTGNDYVVNSNYVVNMSSITGGTTIRLVDLTCNPIQFSQPSIGDIITIYYDNLGGNNCGCINLPTPTPTSSQHSTPTPTPSSTPNPGAPCATPSPTPTPSSSYCPGPKPKIISTECTMSMTSCYPVLTYRIVNICNNEVTLDRPTPDYSNITFTGCYARVIVYPKKMTNLYDSVTPLDHYADDIINFESVCGVDEFNVKIWNMNIPWSENLAGMSSSVKDYTQFGSVNYLGAKEYLGYMSNSGQTFYVNNVLTAETTDTYYYNSFDEKIKVEPKEQKSIAIIHYTNQTIDLFYGEKFALEPYDPTIPYDATGQARNFKLHIPWLMWHKNPECCYGETFWVDPPGFDGLTLSGSPLFKVHYMQSTKNVDMNSPGLRYYNLWDTNPTISGYPSRIGKVFPDDRMIVIDDEEIIAAMSYKSNRNWTLPATKLFLSTPNTCNTIGSTLGVLTGSNETMFVTYRFSNSSAFTESLHCNYYSQIIGPDNLCNPSDSENVGVRFGGNLSCLAVYNDTFKQGFFAEKVEIICQKVTTGLRPSSDDWKIIDMTDQISGSTVNGYITEVALTGHTFVITKDLYDLAPTYYLDNYIPLTTQGDNTSVQLNFGDEYYFYGSLETDIQATIYEMRYKVNLSNSEFLTSTNPTWNTTTKPYLTEIGLYDSDKNLMIVSKLQSPVLRQGIQQFLIKFDF